MEKVTRVIEAEALKNATTMPKLVEVLDGIQEDLRRKVYASFQLANPTPYFRNKYHTFIEDILLDLHQKNPPQTTTYKLYLWTLKYEAKHNLGTLEGNDAHGPLPSGWKAWVVMMLANILVFQHYKLTSQKDAVLDYFEQMFVVNDPPFVISKVPGTAMQVTWQENYERVRDFNRILSFMAAGYQSVFGVTQGDSAAFQQRARPKTIYEILKEEVDKMYPKIGLIGFVVEEDLGPAPLDDTYDPSGLRGDLRWLLQRPQNAVGATPASY